MTPAGGGHARRGVLLALAAAALAAAGCNRGPGTLAYGRDTCAHCRMVIADPRFAAQLVTRTGRRYAFDAVECLAAFTLDGPVAERDVHGRWVADFTEPGRWLPAERAAFLHGGGRQSPMGLALAAFGSEAAAGRVRAEAGGEPLTWDGVLALVRQSRPGVPGHRSG